MPEAFVLFKTLPARERDVYQTSLTTVQSLKYTHFTVNTIYWFASVQKMRANSQGC